MDPLFFILLTDMVIYKKLQLMNQKEEKMRTFIAADFPPKILIKAGKITADLKQQLPGGDIKWVSTDKMHLTIKFIGEIQKNKIDRVKDLMTNILNDQTSFEIGIQNLGTYPHINHPRVIWLGITQGAPLIEIHKQLDEALTDLKVRSDRRKYSPHLTLARVRRETDRDTVKEIGDILSQFKVDSLGTITLGTITISEITLYKSKLTPQGPEYTPLHVVSLNKV